MESLHRVGGGVPDLLVGCQGRNLLIEVKGKRGKLNARQRDWHVAWRGQKCIIRSVDEVVELYGQLERIT